MDASNPQPPQLGEPVPEGQPQMPPKLPPIPGGRTYERMQLPTPEQIAQEDFMNNCATRTVLASELEDAVSGVQGQVAATVLAAGSARREAKPRRRWL